MVNVITQVLVINRKMEQITNAILVPCRMFIIESIETIGAEVG